MDFVKKHYEKVVLGVVLLGLVVVAAFLPVMIASEQESFARQAEVLRPQPKELPPLDLSKQKTLLQRMEGVLRLDFSTTNKLVNPVQWQKKADESFIKVEKGSVGVEAATVTSITPLHLIITLDQVTTSDSGARYLIGVSREAAVNPAQRRKRQFTATLNNKTEAFILREVKGPPDNPSELVLELNDTNETVTLKRGGEFRRVDGHLADLRYTPENKTWLGLRVGVAPRPPIFIAGEEYIVVAILSNEVVLSAKSNNKKTSVPYNPGS
ncbi:MAG: hypothetical protein IH623_21660 [Verrucomicrobia bacterium]|nr:hypothetical protein [Verrucomicrobiota bacterium]